MFLIFGYSSVSLNIQQINFTHEHIESLHVCFINYSYVMDHDKTKAPELRQVII